MIKIFMRSGIMLVIAALSTTNGWAQTLVHYWNFNDLTSSNTSLAPSLSLVPGALLSVNRTLNFTNTEDGFEVANLNARNGDVSGSHLRYQSPSTGAVVDISLPTTGVSDVVVKFAARRSNAGAQFLYSSYTTDGINYTNFDTISLNNAGVDLVTLDFSAITAVNNNANFKVRLTSAQGSGGTGGNHRIDNLTLDGTAPGIADLIPPTASFSPFNGAINQPVNIIPVVSFSEAIRLVNGSPLTNAAADTIFELRLGNASGSLIAFSANVNGNDVSLTPNASFANGATIWVGVKDNRIEDLAGNVLPAGASSIFTTISVQTIFQPGDILPLAYQMNAVPNTDRVALLANVNILPGTILYFTDYKYTDNTPAQCSGPNRITWTAPVGGVPKGTVITVFPDAPSTDVGTVSGGGFGLGANGDQFIIFTGSEVNPSYVMAFSSNAWVTTSPFTTCTGGNSKLPAGLTDGVSSINFSTTPGNVGGNTTNAYYAGPMSGAFVKDSILDPLKWIGTSSGAIAQTWPTYVFDGPPQVISTTVINNTTIQVLFSTTMNAASAQNMANYTGIAGLQSAVLNGGNTVTLTYSPGFISGNSYSLQVANVMDDNGLSMFAPYTFNFNFSTTVTFDGRFSVVNEDAGTATITLNITNPAPFSFDINLRPVGQSTVSAADINFPAMQTINFAGNSNTYDIVIPIVDDAMVEDDEYLFLEILNVSGATFNGANFYTLYIKDNDRQAPVANKEINVTLVNSFDPSATGSTTEVVAYDAVTKRLFATSAIQNRFDIIDFSNPANPVTISGVDMNVYGGSINSLAVKPGLLAVAVEDANPQANGRIAFFDTDGNFITQVTVGAMPDMIVFTPDGTKLLVANEGEPNNAMTVDPEGSISIIDINGINITQANVTTLDFTGYNAQEATLIASGVRKASTLGTLSQNIEPEYISVSADGNTAWVALQENNTIAVVDVANKAITQLLPMGTKDNMMVGNGFDASDNNGVVLISQWPVNSFYIPDAIANYTINGVTYIVTANEGDEREYGPVNERTTVGANGTVLNPANFPHAAMLKESHNLGRFRITNLDGRDQNGVYDELYCVGSRSFSIWNASTGALVYDSGNDIELITAADPVFGALFNSDHGSNSIKNRSRAKGPEPEGVTIGEINGEYYAFVVLERIGGLMVYNVTNPASPVFVDYINTRNPNALGGDLGAETVIFINATNSPDGKNYVVVANEISGTLAIFSVDLPTCQTAQVTLKATGLNALWANAGANDANTFYYGVVDAKRINATVSGGVGPFTYNWSNSGTTNFMLPRTYYPANSIDLFRPTAPTTVTVEVTDMGANCVFSGSIFIDQTDEFFCYVQNNTWFIRMCQNGQTVCVPWTTGRDMLRNNTGTLGACNNINKSDLMIGNELELAIFPNPATDYLTIVAGDINGVATVSIMDISSRLVKTEKVNANAELSIDVSTLPEGMYIITINDGVNFMTEKLMFVRK